ncbi:MAG TPA: NAD(+) kinase [Woeseiaceae bacterium]
MDSLFKTIALVGRFDDPRVKDPVISLVEHLRQHNIRVIVADDAVIDLEVSRLPESEIAAEVDLIIAIGGDGTMLHAAGVAAGSDIPLLGINRGRLGFLADVMPVDMLPKLDQILSGDFIRETRLMLKARLEENNGNCREGLALNDIVIQRWETGRMVDFETRVDGCYINTHSGDGLIVATPTGSTAYALSCGGPIIEPKLEAVVVVPVCPHTLSDRPIVIPASQEIEVRLVDRADIRAEVAADGHSLGWLTNSSRLLISAADKHISLIHPPEYEYYEILRSKLHWGRNSRMRQALEQDDD